MSELSRADLIRGHWGRRRQPQLYPPGALADTALEACCSRCGDCARACPEGIIVGGSGGFPVLDMKRGACTFCGACQRACPNGALDKQAVTALPWHAQIGASCLALQQVECRVCGEVCDARAITYQLAIGRAAQPVLDSSACTGCGECVRTCPGATITLMPSKENPP